MKFQQKLTIITATVNGRLFETGEHAFNEVVIKTNLLLPLSYIIDRLTLVTLPLVILNYSKWSFLLLLLLLLPRFLGFF